MPGLWSPPAGSAHCEFGLRWALTLEDLKKWFREHAPSDAFLVALEKGAVDDAGVRQPTTSGYHYAACTLPQLVALLESARNQPSQLNFYEVRTLRFASLGSISKRPTQYIVDERPRRVGFDLEFELAEERHLARAAVLWPSDYEAVFADKELFLRRTLVDVILPALSALVGRSFSAADCYVTDSSKPAKQSYHVVLDVILPDAPSRLAFHNWIQATFLKGDEAQRLKPLLDCSVYGNGRAMRLVGCNKVGKVPRLVPVASVGGLAFKPTPPFSLETPFTEELLATHMWTAVAGRAGCTELRLRAEAPAPRAKGQRSIPAKRKHEDGGGPAEASLLVNCVEQDVLDALTELGFNVDACQGVSKAGDELRFRYRAVCPLCNADEHGSNFALWTRDGKLFVKSYSGDHAGEAPAAAALAAPAPLEAASVPALVGDGTHLPLAPAFYAEGIAALGAREQPRARPWRLVPVSYTFTTRYYTFLALFEVHEGHLALHADGCRRLLGITDRCDVVIGKKSARSKYAWESITVRFFKELRSWWAAHPVRSALPEPEDDIYTLPCCAAAGCRQQKCRTVTGAPWLHLHELAAHGVQVVK